MKKIFCIIFSLIIILIIPQRIFAGDDYYEINTEKNDLEKKIYRVAGDRAFPPYEYVDKDGNFKGFNVDILNAISLAEEIDFNFIPMKWEDAYYSIKNGQAEIIQGIKKSEERKKDFIFSEPLLINSQSIFVLDSNNDIRNLADLKGKIVALNTKDIVYETIKKIDDVIVIQYDSLVEGLFGLIEEDVDVLIGNTLTVNYICKETNTIDKIKIVGQPLNQQEYCIAVDKENLHLVEKLNEGIYKIKSSGMYDLIHRKWFGTSIKNANAQNNKLIGIVSAAAGILLLIVIIVQKINRGLNEVIEKKTEEHKLLINELRHYDKMQFMDRIIFSIAHEIRNPLTSIKLYTDQMDRKLENKEFMLQASSDISEEIGRIDNLMNEFMEYISPKKANIENLNLFYEISNCLSFIKVQMKGIDIITKLEKNVFIEFDKAQFRQVLLNIFLNSEDAVRNVENPEVSIVAIEKENTVDIIFEDNGYGMEKEEVEYIFEPFYTTKSYGNGIGMFTVKQIVTENEGSIRAYSEGKNVGMNIIMTVKKGASIG